jgi:hypothetical protein
MYFFDPATNKSVWELPEGVFPSGLAVLRDEHEEEFADEDEPPSRVFAREGFILKAGGSGGSWKKRWLVVDRVTQTATWCVPDLCSKRLALSSCGPLQVRF